MFESNSPLTRAKSLLYWPQSHSAAGHMPLKTFSVSDSLASAKLTGSLSRPGIALMDRSLLLISVHDNFNCTWNGLALGWIQDINCKWVM